MTKSTDPFHRHFSRDEWSAFPAFPGHRNSVARAKRALHLHTLVPEHLVVEGARLVDATGVPIRRDDREQIFRLTGNTRVEVWQSGLSDKVPEFVDATLFDCEWHEINDRGMRFDSPKAAWTAYDHTYRAVGMVFEEEDWKPSSHFFKAKPNNAPSGCRRAEYIMAGENGRMMGVQENVIAVEKWKREFKLLDGILDVSESPGKDKHNLFQVGATTAYFLLLRCESEDAVTQFIHKIFADDGLKNELGYDGVQIAIEAMGKLPRGRISSYDTGLTAKIIAAFTLWRSGRQIKGKDLRSPHLGTYCKKALLRKD